VSDSRLWNGLWVIFEAFLKSIFKRSPLRFFMRAQGATLLGATKKDIGQSITLAPTNGLTKMTRCVYGGFVRSPLALPFIIPLLR